MDSHFLEAFRVWEFSSDLNLMENMASQVTVEENSPMQVKETIESNINNDMSRQIRMSAYLCIKLHQKQRETKLQIQQILAAEAVAM